MALIGELRLDDLYKGVLTKVVNYLAISTILAPFIKPLLGLPLARWLQRTARTE